MPESKGLPTPAGRLNRLFETIRPHGPRGRVYTNEEVATAVKESHPHIRVGGAYLSALRTGTKKNPSTELLTALARFFGVPASYFLDDETAAQTDAELALAQVAHNLGVRRLALRALELTPEGLAAVTRIVEHVLDGSVPGAVQDDGGTRNHPAP
ncbi:helix-turn-helix transcriptional regulator [Streptomyces sp. TRM 70351]|uniref:helix-turn-helix transcriptional regulator n=1 Tax=Streptomyces sp. TRM 70351 TaxID=3116552 RepID=UPI002E7AC1EB|nr:helix-turn-helix transcriptional regulator [Streptomyces sp. TRM 70351]MEE1929209.1 helix-turn-helix transcriptional regulator [Streptomyces sp. TRM 70351]